MGQREEAQPNTPAADVATVATVLAGHAPYDDLGPDDQALVRAEWDKRIEAHRASLDFETEFRAAGLPWVEADTDGNTITRS